MNLLWVFGCRSLSPSRKCHKQWASFSHLTARVIPRCSFDSPGLEENFGCQNWCLVLGAKNCISNPQISPWSWHGLQLSRDSWAHLRYTKDISLALSGTDNVLPHTRRVVYFMYWRLTKCDGEDHVLIPARLMYSFDETSFNMHKNVWSCWFVHRSQSIQIATSTLKVEYFFSISCYFILSVGRPAQNTCIDLPHGTDLNFGGSWQAAG